MSTAERTGLSADQVIEVITSLAQSQGFYSRMLSRILDAKENNPDVYEEFCDIVEKQNFKDAVDIVMYFES